MRRLAPTPPAEAVSGHGDGAFPQGGGVFASGRWIDGRKIGSRLLAVLGSLPGRTG
jgi:hypothetical protein